MLYAVQYRNMHTAIHHFSIFDDRDAAVAAAETWKENGTPGPGFEEHWLDDFAIHWKYPPKYCPYTDEPIEVVNQPFDCHGIVTDE